MIANLGFSDQTELIISTLSFMNMVVIRTMNININKIILLLV